MNGQILLRQANIFPKRNINLDPLLNGPFYRCQAFRIFSLKQKKKPRLAAQFIMPNLVNMRSFIGIRRKLIKIWEPKLANFYKEMYARGQRLHLWGCFFFAYMKNTKNCSYCATSVKIGSFTTVW